MISMRIYKQGDEILISACDEKLIGKIFEEGKYLSICSTFLSFQSAL